jgi:sugar phosphate isomerase/epimerase
MRFGITAAQADALIPPGLPAEQLFAYLAGLDYSTLIPRAAAHGFNPIEISADLAIFFPRVFAPPMIEAMLRLKQELGLGYTVHLPLWSVEPSTPLAPVRQGSLQALIEHIRLTLPLDPEVYVLHATGALAAEFSQMRLPEAARGLVLRQYQTAARQSLKTLLAETGLAPRRLAIETIEFPFELTLELAEELDCAVCFDTGHVLVGFSGPVDFFEALERCLPRLGEVHLHDGPWQGPQRIIGYGKDHQAIGRGDLDTARFLDRLEQAGYRGPLVFELGLEAALESMQVIRGLRPDLAAELTRRGRPGGTDR